MIINTEQNQISRIFNKSEMGIKVDALAHQMMIDGIYSNKLNSVFREISTNARDSHIQSGNTNPFEIDIYTSTNNPNHCTVTITDYGMGMSEEEVLTYLCNLNSSSKRNNNDVVGCFGIGSKSVFSLTDTYTYECVQDGVLTKLLLSKDKNGTPNFRHSSTATNRVNSVICNFAIKENLTNILNAIYEELSLFDIKPIIKIINNNTDVFVTTEYIPGSSLNYYYGPETFFPVVIEREHFYIINQSNTMSFLKDYMHNKHISCGVIGYKLDNYSTANTGYSYNNFSSNFIGIIPKFALGEIKFGVSREIIENTPETNDLLAKKLIDIYSTFPNRDEIVDILTVTTRYPSFRYSGNAYDFGRQKTDLIRSYSSSVLSPQEQAHVNNEKVSIEYLMKDYLTNKISLESDLDHNLLDHVLNRNGGGYLFKLFQKIPPNIFMDRLNISTVDKTEVLIFYTVSNLSTVDRDKLNYYSQLSLGKDTSVIKKNVIGNFLFFTCDLKGTAFYSNVDENVIPKYIYSHKTFGSNTHLDSLKHKNIHLIKFSRAQDLDSVNSYLKVAQDIYDMDLIHLDAYKEIDPDFCNTLKPVRKVPIITSTTAGIVEEGRSTDGLRLRSKHDKIVLHRCTYLAEESLDSTTYTDSTALTSTQCYNILQSLYANYYKILVFSEDILTDASVMDDYDKRSIIILLSEQSDPEEILEIIKLLKKNSTPGPLIANIDKSLSLESYESSATDFKTVLLRSVIYEHHQKLYKYSLENLDDRFTDTIRSANFMFNNIDLSNLISRAYFNRHDNQLVDYFISNLDKFKKDFLGYGDLKNLLKEVSDTLYPIDIAESLPQVRLKLYGDDNV